MPACGKAEGETNDRTGVFSVVPLSEKAPDMIQPITNFHKFEKIYSFELYSLSL